MNSGSRNGVLKKLYGPLRHRLLPIAVLAAMLLLVIQWMTTATPESTVRAAAERLESIDRQMVSGLNKILEDTSAASVHQSIFHSGGAALGISYFLFENETLKLWSDNEPDLSLTQSDLTKDRSLLQLPNGIFWVRKAQSGPRSAIALLLIRHLYAYENRYLKNGFNPVIGLPEGASIGDGPVLHAPDGSALATVDSGSIATKAAGYPVLIAWWIILAAFVAGCWLQAAAGSVAVRLVAVMLLVSVRLLLLELHVPRIVYDTDFFSPSVYASSAWIHSLGDLLLNGLFLFPAALLLVSLFPMQLRRSRIFIGAIVVALSSLFLYLDHYLVKGLVLDSHISFNVGDLSTIDHHTLAALFILAFIFTAEAIIVSRLLRGPGIRLAGRHAVFALLAFSLLTTLTLQHFVSEREKDARVQFAQRVGMQRDHVAEYFISTELERIKSDSEIIRMVRQLPDPIATGDLINRRYIRNYLSRFEVSVSFRPSSFQDAFIDSLIDRNVPSLPTGLPGIYFSSEQPGRIQYVALLPFATGASSDSITLMIHFRSRIMSASPGFPELFVSGTLRDREIPDNYSYAIYESGLLSTEFGTYPYSYSSRELIPDTTADVSEFSFEGFNHLVYHGVAGSFVIVSKPETTWFSIVTLFSWILTLFGLFLGACYLLLPVANTHGSLSRRIQWSVFMLVILSFAGIGTGTIRYIFSKNESDQRRIVGEQLNGLWSLVNPYAASADTIRMSESGFVKDELQRIVSNTNIDFNLYDRKGNLYFSSQPRIFDQGIISSRMHPEALYELNAAGKTQFLHPERIGSLDYIAAYAPFFSADGSISSYLQLPYFENQKERSREISGFLSALLNIYVLLFAVAVFIAAFISSRITHPLSLIQERMAGIRLGRRNEPISYKANDEIGQLVVEYNRMLRELSDSAELLAQSERESAWREMAKQVAHEIKNPLTPMKLSVQQLQRAWKEHRDDREAMTERMASTLIQQIDTLSSIATEFSNFAKMPKAEPQPTNLVEVLQHCIDLFRESSAHAIFFETDSDEVVVMTDTSQLNRVFSNLIKNAMQAIPQDSIGKIEIACRVMDGAATVTITDNGVGIDETQRSRIFVPNFTTKSGGTGLGLAMVKNIVEQGGGTVGFESVPGNGATFMVSLPLASRKD